MCAFVFNVCVCVCICVLMRACICMCVYFLCFTSLLMQYRFASYHCSFSKSTTDGQGEVLVYGRMVCKVIFYCFHLIFLEYYFIYHLQYHFLVWRILTGVLMSKQLLVHCLEWPYPLV